MSSIESLYFHSHISDWFPGWMGKYDSEPSSNTPSEDCVELRQSFPGVLSKNYKQKNNEVIQEDMEAVTTPHDEVKNNQLYWSDQECREENWFICAKAMVISKGGKCYLS